MSTVVVRTTNDYTTDARTIDKILVSEDGGKQFECI